MDTRSKIVEEGALPLMSGRGCVARGWFDVLTAEHGRLLGDAKAEHGRLVVLVYQDSATRPAPLVAADRAQMVAALESVDLVCKCDAVRAESIIAALRPAAQLDVDAFETRDVVRDVLACHSEH